MKSASELEPAGSSVLYSRQKATWILKRPVAKSSVRKREEDSELKERAAEKEAIHRSRQHQVEQKAQQTQKEQQSARDMVRQWNEFGQRIELQAHLDSLCIPVEQKQQAEARQKTHVEERAAAVFAHKESVNALAKENKQRGIDNVFPIK